MKKIILEITEQLKTDVITLEEAQHLLLDLFGMDSKTIEICICTRSYRQKSIGY